MRMENQLCSFFPENRDIYGLCKEERQRIQSNLGMLRKTLNRHQRKLLLRILDDKDLITEQIAEDSYADGFRTAVKIMIESLYIK